MAAGDLATLADVKDWLGISSSDTTRDARLSRLITAASTRAVAFMGRGIAAATYTETYRGSGGVKLGLRNFPVISVTSLAIDGTAIPAASQPASGPPSNGYIVTNLGSPIVKGALLTLYGYAFTDAGPRSNPYGNVALTYQAGYASIPGDISQAIIEFVQALDQRRSIDINISSESISGVGSVSYKTGDSRGIPDPIADALLPYVADVASI